MSARPTPPFLIQATQKGRVKPQLRHAASRGTSANAEIETLFLFLLHLNLIYAWGKDLIIPPGLANL